ncbi:MAG: 6-bladed beta-propeller [Bacteroidota bacterium]
MNNKIKTSILLIFFFIFLTSCIKDASSSLTQEDYIFFPSPPDTARIQFLTSINSSLDIEGDQSGINKLVFGEAKPNSIVKPYGVVMHNGKIYVCDTGIKGIVIIDLALNTFEYFIPEGKGRLMLPLSCFVDNDGKLFVADGNRKQIVVFDKTGKYIHAFGEPENFKPTDVFVTKDKIWVANVKNHHINVYKNDSTFQSLYYFPEIEHGSEAFLNQPTNIKVVNDKVYVTDFGSFKVKMYHSDGSFIGSIGSYGKGLGQFVRPKGIALDRESNLYVVDAAFENIQIFNKNKQLLMFFGGGYSGAGSMSLPAKVDINYENIKYFEPYVDPLYQIKYLILVTNLYGGNKLNIYARVEPKG